MLKSSSSGLLIIERPNYAELEKIYKQVFLVPATKHFDDPITAHRLSQYKHLFGVFFLGSHMYLPIKGEGYSKASHSKLQFPVGPMVCFDENIHLSGRRLSHTTRYNLKSSIGNMFQAIFEDYLTSPYVVVREFLRTQGNAIDHLRKLIIEDIGLRYSSKAVSKWVSDRLIFGSRLGLTYDRITSSGFGNIRTQIEAAIQDGDNTLLLDLMLSKPSGGENYKILVDLNKFLEEDIRVWRQMSVIKENIDTVKAREMFANTINLLGVLKSMVSVLGVDGKVRLFPLYDTEDISLGYQFLVPSQATNKYITDIPSQGYFDVDVGTDEGIFTLIHAINMMYSGKFAFVMKKPDGTLNDGEMICAFNREGFLQPDEIFSLGSASGMAYEYRKLDHFVAYRMVITKLSTIFIGKDEEWLSHWSFGGGWSSTHSNLKNDYDAYHNYIRDIDMHASNKQNNYIQAYLIQVESRFNGFIPFIQEMLGI